MTTNTNTNTNTNTDDLGIPAFLRRTKTDETKQAKPAKEAKAKPAKDETSVGEETRKNPRSIVPTSFKRVYAQFGGTCGDNIATALKRATTTKNKDGRECLDIEALREIARENGVDFSRYEHLNNGQKRMNVGNKLRGIVEAGGKVTIAGKRFGSISEATEEAAKRIVAKTGKKAA